MTELYINGNYIELDNSELLPTSQVADIFSVEDIYSGITKQFSAPKTASNKAALEGCDSIGAITYIPYRRNTAKLLIDGVEVFFNAIAIIDSTGDAFEIIIKYGNSDFFSLLTRKLSELDLSALEHAWTMAQVAASQNYDYSDGYTWQLIDFGLQKLQPRFNVRQALPSVFVRYLIEKIASDNGYTLSGAVWTSADFSSDTIPLLDRAASDSVRTKMQVLAWQDSIQAMGTVFPTSIELQFNDVLNDAYSLFDSNKYYKAPVDCEVNVTAYIPVKHYYAITPEVLTVTFELVRYQIDGTEEIIATTQLSMSVSSPEQVATFNKNVVLSEYDKLGIRSTLTGSFYNYIQVGDPNYSTLWVQIVSAANTSPGMDYPISENLPDMTESELFKAVAMKYGLIYQTDNAAKILYAERFEDIAGRMNTNESYNWTEKLDLSEQDGDYERININFRTEMGQKSWFRFAEDETLPKFYKDASFNIDDTTLQKSFDYVEFPFAASKMVVRAGYSMPEIKLYTDYDGGQNSIVKRWLQNSKQSTSTLLLKGKSDITVKLTSTGTVLGLALTGATSALLIDWDTNKETTINAWISEHNQTLNNLGVICYRISNDSIRFITKALGCAFSNVNALGGDVSISVTDNSENYTHTGDVSLATFTDAGTILSTYYSAQERMFNYYKRITCKVWLSVYDFVNFSHYKPVYITDMGWFYVEKINGFRTDASTEVEMVALDSFINAGRSEFSFDREIDSLEVVFTSESTNALSYKWDFGDGTQSTSQNPIKTYTSCGVYNVTLTVTDTQGVNNKLAKTINVPKPSLRFNFKCNSQYISNII